MRRIIMAIAILAIVLGACGSKPRTYNYYDFDSGAAVRITCDNSWANGVDKDTCAIVILDDGL
jgi:uncharacterized lipoprotein YmbA